MNKEKKWINFQKQIYGKMSIFQKFWGYSSAKNFNWF